jgi:FKBP12-rapamycin complex-associated protein
MNTTYHSMSSLGDRNENRRYAAVLILSELAQNAPTLIYAYVPQYLDLIWIALRDMKMIIREAAAGALSACLNIIVQRESPQRSQWYNRILEEADKGLKANAVESIHGSLLTYRELLQQTGPVSIIVWHVYNNPHANYYLLVVNSL